MTNRGAAAAAMVLSALGVTTAEANDRDIRSIMLSATACQVDRNSPFEADPFKGPESISRFTRGSYTLLCPLPINNVELSSTAADNDLSKFRVHYRDSDGRGAGGRITVILSKSFINSSGFLITSQLCTFNSNSDGAASSAYQKATKTCVQDIDNASFYTFFIELENNGSEVNFVGIDFPQ